MANDFGANYIIGISLTNLQAIQELRAELQALREDSKAPIDFKVNVTPNTADNIGKVVEEKVAAGIEKGAARAKRGSGASAASGATVGFDPAQLQKLDSIMSKLVTALESQGRAGAQPVEATVDPKAIAAAVAEGVSSAMARSRGAGKSRSVEKPLTPSRRESLAAEAEALNDVSVTPKALKRVTEKNSAEVLALIERRAEVIGGKLKEQVETLKGSVAELAEASANGGSGGKTVGTNSLNAAIDGVRDAQDEMSDMIVSRTQALLTESSKMLEARYQQLDGILTSGLETVTVKANKKGTGALDSTLKRSTLKLEKAFERVGENIAKQLSLFTDTLVDRISTLKVTLAASELGSQAADEVLQDAAQPSRRRRVVKTPALRDDPIRPEGAHFDYRGREVGRVRGDLNDEERERLAASGRAQLEKLREKEAKRRKLPVATGEIYDRLEKEFMQLPREEARELWTASASHQTYFGKRDASLLREVFGGRFGSETETGGIRLPARLANESKQGVTKVLAAVRKSLAAGAVNQDTAAAYADAYWGLGDNPLQAQLPRPKDFTMASVPDLISKLSPAKDLLVDQEKLYKFVSSRFKRPEFSPVSMQMAIDADAARALTLPTESAKGGNPQAELLAQVEGDRRRLASWTKQASQMGFEFTPFQDAERAQVLRAMNDATGMTEGTILDVRGNKPKYSDIQNGKSKLRDIKVGGFDGIGGYREWQRNAGVAYGSAVGLNLVTPDGENPLRPRGGGLQMNVQERMSEMLDFGGEWHQGEFTGFRNSVFHPERRDIGDDPSMRMLQHGPQPLSADMRRMMAQRTEKVRSEVANIERELKITRAQLAKAQERVQELAAQVPELEEDLRRQQAHHATEFAPEMEPTGPGMAGAALSFRNARANSLDSISIAERTLKRAQDAHREVQNRVRDLPPSVQKLEARLAAARIAEQRAAEEAQREALAESVAGTTTGTAAGAGIETAQGALSTLSPLSTPEGRQQAYEALRAAAAAKAKGAPEPVAGAAGGGGGQEPPVVPPMGTGGPGDGGGFKGFGGPGEWREFVAAMKALESVRLEGLTKDLRDIVSSMSELRKVGGSQWAKMLSAAGARGKLDLMDKTLEAKRIDAERVRYNADQKLASTQLWADTMAGLGGRGTGAVARMSASYAGEGSDPFDLGAFGLADRFLKLRAQTAGKQLTFDNLMNTVDGNGEHPASVQRALGRTATEIDARRQTMMDTIVAASLKVKRLQPLGYDIEDYAQVVGTRAGLDLKRSDMNRMMDMSGPVVPEELRKKQNQEMLKSIQELRVAEDAKAKSILSGAAAEFEAIRATEKHGTYIDRLSNKMRSLAMYATAGGLIYTGIAAARGMFEGAVGIEKSSADIQSVLGNHSATEREQLRAGVLQSSIDYGGNIQDAMGMAKLFAQSGMGASQVTSTVRAGMMGNLGLGLDTKQSSEMLLAVDSITKGAVTAADIMDRISSVSSKYAVTGQDLSVAIQKVGALAQQLQPGRVGRMDSMDFVLGATAAQVTGTRAGGEATSTALRMILARLGSPQTIKQIQDTYGVKLAANKEGTELRPLFDIFSDLAKTYKDLQHKEATGASASGIAAQFLNTVVGTRQANQGAALFSGWDEAMKASGDSARAWGESQRRAAVQMDTFAFQTERMKNAALTFTSEVLKSAGVLGLLKAGSSALGTAANVGKEFPGLAPLAGGAALLGLSYGAKMLSGSATMAAAKEAFAAGGTAMTVGTVAKANLGSLVEGFAVLAGRIGMTVAGFGTLAAALAVTTYAYHKWTERGPLQGPDIDEDELRKSDLYQAYQKTALDNGMSASGLADTVIAAARRAQDKIRNNPTYAGIKNDIFTNDDDRRKYNRTLADATTKAFTDELSKAVPAIAAIKDESERASAALALLKQSAQVTHMQSNYTAAFQENQLGEVTKKMQDDILSMQKDGVFGFKATPNGYRNTGETVDQLLHRGFGIFGDEVSRTKLLDAQNHMTTVFGMISKRMETTGEVFGVAFDNVAASTLELNDAQVIAVEQVKKRLGTSLSADPGRQRAQIINNLGGDASGARKVLQNQRLLEDALYLRMKGAMGATPLNTVGDVNQGGVRGSDIMLNAIIGAGRRRVAEMRRAGGAGDAANVLDSTLTTMGREENRDAFNMMTMKGGNFRANFRERILDQIIRYSAADSGAREGGGALKAAGVATDIAAERSQAANAFVRGLYEAKANVNGDVLRAASKVAEFQDLANNLAKQPGQVGEVNPTNEQLAASQSVLQATLKQLSPEEKTRLTTQLGIARRTAAQIADNDDIFRGMPAQDQATIREILKGGGGLDRQALNFTRLGVIAQKLAEVMDDRLTQEQVDLQAVSLRAAADNQILQLTQEAAKAARGRRIAFVETFGGAGAAGRLQRADLTSNYDAAVAAAELAYKGKIAAIEKDEAQHSGRRETARNAAQADLETAMRAAGSALVIGNAALTDTLGKLKLQRDLNYQTRYLETGEGALGRLRGSIASARASGEIGTPAEEEALRDYQLSVRQRYLSQSTSMTQSAESGIRAMATSYDTMKGRALGARVAKPMLDTMSNQVANSFLTTLTGPQGLLGGQVAKMFNSQMFLEADMIRNAHIEGIMSGFQAVYGGTALGVSGAGGSLPYVPGGVGDVGAPTVSTSPISRTEQLKQLALTGGTMAGNLLGGEIGSRMGVNRQNNYGSEGAQLGSTVGAALGSMTPLGPIGGAIGGALGGLVGGLFGGRVGKQNPPPAFSALDRIDRNTRETVTAVENQTKSLLNLENRLLNVPVTFRLPGYAVAGGGAGTGDAATAGAGPQINVQVHVTEARSPKATADAVTADLSNQLRTMGSFVSPRGSRN